MSTQTKQSGAASAVESVTHMPTQNNQTENDEQGCEGQTPEQLIASIPMPQQDLLDLFDHLARDGARCNTTLRETVEFLQKRGLDVGRIVTWLEGHGGYCDCEIIMNVYNTFGTLLDDEDLDPATDVPEESLIEVFNFEKEWHRIATLKRAGPPKNWLEEEAARPNAV